MNSRTSQRRQQKVEAAQKDASGARICPEAAFRMDLRPDFRWPQPEVPEKERDERRRSFGTDKGENQILGGSDPTLSGFSAAQCLRHRGSLPPNVSNRMLCSVAGRVVGEAVRKSESHQPEENNTCH